MAKKIIFIRHGESESNAGEKTATPGSINLTPVGRKQARDKAAALDVTPDLIVTSSYVRTKQTAEPFFDRFGDARSEEWNVHEFTFLAAEKYKDTTNAERKPALLEYWRRANTAYRDEGSAESFNDFVDRCRQTIENMKNVDAETTLVFCHGYTMNCIRYILEGNFDKGVTPQAMLAFWDYHAENNIENCGTLEFDIDGGNVTLAKKPPPRPPGKRSPVTILD